MILQLKNLMVSAEKNRKNFWHRKQRKEHKINSFVSFPLALILMSCNLISRFDFLISQLKERIFFSAREEKDSRNEMREIRRKVKKEAKKFRVDCIFETFSSPLGNSCDALYSWLQQIFLSPSKLIEIWGAFLWFIEGITVFCGFNVIFKRVFGGIICWNKVFRLKLKTILSFILERVS